MEGKWLKVIVHASTWFAPILVPLIVLLLSGDKEVRRISLQALVFHIVMGVLIWLSIVFSFILIGIPFLIIFGLIAIIAPIMGIVYALGDRTFNYPMIGRLIK
ncbi:DUF4870 domain-containing protein [Fictibacillus sp. Mic-4]|uniref:DUF4870 domain-containing protein n=1 Tax=Fictibacillus TaxID=1329200 RepID=UPI0004203088|nr:DUF4870 domain-containing protein [Fictibacillus gelatini]